MVVFELFDIFTHCKYFLFQNTHFCTKLEYFYYCICAWGQFSHLSYIYLGYFVGVCVSQFVAERSAILIVLVIKLTKETRRGIEEIRDGEIEEGGCEETFLCLILT